LSAGPADATGAGTASSSPPPAQTKGAAQTPTKGDQTKGDDERAAPTAQPQEKTAGVTAGPYKLEGPLRRVIGGRSESKTEPFDLQAHSGHGKPIALIFWAPGFRQSERALVDWASFLKQNTPQFEVYAVSGRGEKQRDEEIW